MRSLKLVTTLVVFLALAGKASALTIEVPVTAAYLKEHPKSFTIDAEKRADGLIHFKIVRHLTEPKYLVSHFKVRDKESVVESHNPAFVHEKTATYHLVVSPKHLANASFDLSEHGFDEDVETPIPWIGGTDFQIRLADFAPKASAEAGK